MSRLTRQLIFIIVFIISLCGISLVLLYGSGYRINWQDRTIQSTSGITIVTIPKRARVTIDPTGIQRIAPIVGSLLEPRRYTITVTADGYQTAEYSILLQPRQAIQLDPVILWPAALEVTSVTTYPRQAMIQSPSQIIYNQIATTLLWNESKDKAALFQETGLMIYDSNSKSITTLLRQHEPITAVAWHPSNWYIFYATANELHVFDTRLQYGRNDTVLYAGSRLHDIRVHPTGRAVFVTTATGIQAITLR